MEISANRRKRRRPQFPPTPWWDMTETAPQTLDELRRLYIRIRNGEHPTRLTDRTLAVLKRMLDAPNETAAKSISEIARENDLNISSITRLAQKLGFEGFPGLKALFRENLSRRKRFYTDQVRRFLERGHLDSGGRAGLLERMIQDEWSNVMMMAEAFDERAFDAILERIVQAERIRILGLRGSYPLAHYLHFYLKMIRDGVALVGGAGHTLAEDLSSLRPGDLLMALGVRPYTRETAEACRVCRREKVDVVALTDSPSSPLAVETDHYLLTAIEGDFFFSPIAAAVICIETLLSALVKRLGDEAIQRLNHAESILEKLETEL